LLEGFFDIICNNLSNDKLMVTRGFREFLRGLEWSTDGVNVYINKIRVVNHGPETKKLSEREHSARLIRSPRARQESLGQREPMIYSTEFADLVAANLYKLKFLSQAAEY
jgi:hypothetical protein